VLKSATEAFLAECVEWNAFDANVYLGHSGTRGVLALEAPELLAEMDRFGIARALVSHNVGLEYDAVEGNHALMRDAHQRFVPAWTVTPDAGALLDFASREAKAARLWFATSHHNFSSAAWCSGEVLEQMQHRNVLALISKSDIDWDALHSLLENFPRLNVLLLEIGYRADRYMNPLLKKFPNLYFDTSMYAAHRQLEWHVETIGPERMIYGSRLPYYTPGASLAMLGTARISDAAKVAVAGGNLRRLLGESA